MNEPTVDEIRGVFSLIRACESHWADPGVWRAQLAGGIRDILGGGVGLIQLAQEGENPERPDVIPLLWSDWGSPEKERCYLDSLLSDDRPALPNFGEALGPALIEGSVAFSRRMIVPDEKWYQSPFYNGYVKPTGMDEFALGLTLAPHLGSVVMVGGNREEGAAPIAMKTVQLLGILAEEIAPLLGTRLSLDHQVSMRGLSPRQRQTLELLLDGLSEKQVAHELGLSPKTVHDYVVRLHKHFDVSSRGELLSYFIKRQPKGPRGA